MRKTFFSCLFLASTLSGHLLIAQTETSGRERLYRQTTSKTTEIIHTKLKVGFDFDKEQLLGEEWLTARPYFYATNQLELDAKSMLITEVALMKNGQKTLLKYVYKDDVLKIELDKNYSKSDQYTVYIKYTAQPKEIKQKGSEAISDAKGLYFINPKGEVANSPTQIWTQGETESSSCWFPTIDKPNQKSTQEIEITVPDKYVTLSNGLLKSSVKKEGNLRTDHWVMDKRHSVYLFFMGIGDYAIIKDKWRNIDVDYYVEHEYKDTAKEIFGKTPEMIEFFSKKLNYDYPWSKYAQLVGKDYVSGAMENTTAVIHQEDAQQTAAELADENRWEGTIAHELFHHWFGDLVTAESWSNLSLNESFATYSVYLWYEFKYGKETADHHMMTDLKVYHENPANLSKNLIRFDYESREDMFDGISYNKGSGILHMLRNYLGDEAFFEGLHDYLKSNEYNNGEASQLRLSFEKISGKDLNWFFNQWYFSNSHPNLEVKYSYEPIKKQILVDINQTQKTGFFEFPFAIDIYENGLAKRKNIWVKAQENSKFVFDYQVKPELVIANANQVLLCELTEDKPLEQYYLQYQKSTEYKSRKLALDKAITNINTDNNALKTVVMALGDSFFELRRQALQALDLSDAKHAAAALLKVEKLSQSDPKTLVRADALFALSKTKNQKYLSWFEKGMSAVSKAINTNSLLALFALAPEKIESLKDKLDLKGASEEVLNKLVPIVVEKKIVKQMPHIAQLVAFYPFMEMQKLEVAKSAKEGFEWIMSSDSPEATTNVLKYIGLVKSQIKDNPMVKKILSDVLNNALDKKMQALKKEPSSSLSKQVEMINKSIESFNK